MPGGHTWGVTEYFTPGQVVDRLGFSHDTLRYYERIGVLGPLGRDSVGRRRFNTADLDWLETVRYLRDTGMPLDEIRRYSQLAQEGEDTATMRLELLLRHEERVTAHIAHLNRQHEQLRQKIGWYRDHLRSPGAAAS
jgi:DNA-binding transcriptional MerR regulator